MIKKFLRSEWGRTGKRKIGHLHEESNVRPTLDILDLFESFEERISELQERVNELEKQTKKEPKE